MSKHSVQLRHVVSWKLFTIVGVIFLIAVLLLMFRGQAEKGSVEILQDGKIIKTLSKSELEHDTSFQISYGEHYNIVQIKNGKKLTARIRLVSAWENYPRRARSSVCRIALRYAFKKKQAAKMNSMEWQDNAK